MAVFAIIGTENPAAMKAAIVAQYGLNHYEFAPNAWFVSDGGTTKIVSDKLGITNGQNAVQGVVLKFSGYSGRTAATAWTWLQTFPLEAVPNG
jgi:hypothetical protein